MTDINEIKLSYTDLQYLYELGDNAALKEYLCKVTGRPFCRVCTGFHKASWTKHPVALIREALETYVVRGR